jgi:hypothetical protein
LCRRIWGMGAMVFLFAPNDKWMQSDPWIAADAG